jgi:hypothetical protein
MLKNKVDDMQEKIDGLMKSLKKVTGAFEKHKLKTFER